jgi:hypothetical protein
MTAQTLDQPRFAPSPILLAAWSTIVGGVITIVGGIPLASFQAQEPTLWWVPTLNAVSHLFLLWPSAGRGGGAGWPRHQRPWAVDPRARCADRG